MDCKRFRRLIQRELDGGATPEQRSFLADHLKVCPGCRSFKRSIRELNALHRELPELEPPAGLVDRVMEQVESGKTYGSRPGWNVIVPAAAAVFVVFLGIVAGSYIASSMVGPPAGQQAEIPGFEYLEAYPPDSFGEVMQVATFQEASDE
jgi:predicted anti-sigma-YlaC factor YlaD